MIVSDIALGQSRNTLTEEEKAMQTLVTWCQNQEQRLGRILLILGVGMVGVAFPAQIWKAYQEQHMGIHWIMLVLPLFIYVVRIPYSVAKMAWAIMIPDVIGLALCCVMLGQLWYYNS